MSESHSVPALEFAGRVVVVTGGSRGIGRAIADAFGRHGAVGIVIDYRSGAEETVAMLRAAGADAMAVAGDVADPATARSLARAPMERWGRLDAWVNNAGVTADGPFLRMPEERWRRVLDTNWKGPATAALRRWK
jgi:3-oxoacyl-[acyl-carrier protein] reductase